MSGYAAGRHHREAGGGSNYLCLPEDPRWKGYLNNTQASAGWLYGVTYHTNHGTNSNHEVLLSGINHGGSQAFHGKPTPCAVCYVPHRSAHLMIPVSDMCPDDWTLEYDGYLMADHSFPIPTGVHTDARYSTNYICVDGAPEVAVGPTDQFEAIVLFVKVRCGTLPCSTYPDGRELVCVVCTK